MSRMNKELEKKQPEKPSFYEERLKSAAQRLHMELFPEEYDFMSDSFADAEDRRRGVDPMSAEYRAKVAERRAMLGVAPYRQDAEDGLKDSYEYCLEWVKHADREQAPARHHNAVRRMARALHFAAEKHVDQRRKGERAEPYFNHLAEVAHVLAEACNGEDENLVLAGLLHDTIEDTDTEHSELEEIFGRDVADLVEEVSDDKSLDKGERKWLQVEKAHKKSDRAKCLEIADKTCNLRALIQSPPSAWEAERIREYFKWAKKVVNRCRGRNKWLEKQFDAAYAEGQKRFGFK